MRYVPLGDILNQVTPAVDWTEVGKVYGMAMEMQKKIDFWKMIRMSAIKHKPTRWMRFKRFFTRRQG